MCTFRKCLIEMMTCASGEARCQEKAALEKCPANQTYILDNKDTRFVRASRGFLIWLKESCQESCQDYYRRVNMTHSLHPARSFLCCFEFSRETKRVQFLFRGFLVPQSHGAEDWHLNTDDSAQYFPYAPGLGLKEKTFCPVYHMLDITSKRN